MLSNFLSRLQSIFRPMSSSSSDEGPDAASNAQSYSRFILKPGRQTDVETFMTDYFEAKLGDAEIARRWQELSQHYVIKLEYRKRSEKGDKAEHEFVVAYIVDHEQKTARLKIERFGNNDEPATGRRKSEKTTQRLLNRLKEVLGEVSEANAQPTPPSVGLLAVGSTALASASRSVTSLDGTVASMPRSSQDSSYKPKGSEDRITSLRPSYVFPPDEIVLRVFEPTSRSLSLLHLGVIAEAVHDEEPDYQLFRSQCYWFSMMVMGIAMLQGGRVQICEKPRNKKAAEPPWTPLNPHTSTNANKPANLDQTLPIPSPSSEDIKRVTDVAGAGKTSSVAFGIITIHVINVSFDVIWKVGRESQDHYKSLAIRLAQLQNKGDTDLKNAVAAAKKEAEERAEAYVKEAKERAELAEAHIKELQEQLEHAEARVRELQRQGGPSGH